jgi:hypothetical protein
VEGFLIFISYRRGESAGYAGRLHESLERRLGDGHIFRDVDELEPGQDFVDAIAARLRDCAACLVMIGAEWLLVTDRSDRRRLEQANDYVRLEIEAALARPDLLVVPVLVEGAAMPSAEDLPASIRALSRRHALSLRDETWDSDVDRLVAILEKRIGRRTIAGEIGAVSRLPRLLPGRAAAWAALAVALIAAAMFLTRSAAPPDMAATAPAPGASAAGSSVAGGSGTISPARALTLPRLAEAAHGGLIYTILSGDAASRGGNTALRFRIRLSNEGRYPVNFADIYFRFAVPGQTISAAGGLNEIVEGHSIKQGVISFDLPAAMERGVLQIVVQDTVIEIPLDIKITNAPSSVDTVDTGDALSRAQVMAVATKPVSIEGGDVDYTLERVIARTFTNTLRIIVTVRAANNGRYQWYLGSSALRLVVDGQPLAPFDTPETVVEPSSSASGDFQFDVPSRTRRLTVRVTEPKAESAFDLPFAQ